MLANLAPAPPPVPASLPGQLSAKRIVPPPQDKERRDDRRTSLEIQQLEASELAQKRIQMFDPSRGASTASSARGASARGTPDVRQIM